MGRLTPTRSQYGGCGGVIRNNQGTFIFGFTLGQVIGMDCLSAELWALLMGTKHAWRLRLRQIMIATDSQDAVDLVKNGDLHQLVSASKSKMKSQGERVRYALKPSDSAFDLLRTLQLSREMSEGPRLVGPTLESEVSVKLRY
ncbi:uncharacterized protein LOC129322086 [Prosopis cineraria]|uniref:uncharacterized protein LOC129322086 n=1 Tax=Prosopis cineraria TaxID=364024 RepID=UPI0024100E7F|nr:uncharacterized protein LOC129322086 [Prosopis cineraria]